MNLTNNLPKTIGAEVFSNAEHFARVNFAPDWKGVYLFITAPAEVRQKLQGGTDFSAFMAERFGMSKQAASNWRRIGEEYDNIVQLQSRFAPDWKGVYLFITAPPEVRQKLQGGTDFSAFMAERFGYTRQRASKWKIIGDEVYRKAIQFERFGMSQGTAYNWKRIGLELHDNIVDFPGIPFAADWRGVYLFITAPPEVRQKLIASGATIDQKTVGAARRLMTLATANASLTTHLEPPEAMTLQISRKVWGHDTIATFGRPCSRKRSGWPRR